MRPAQPEMITDDKATVGLPPVLSGPTGPTRCSPHGHTTSGVADIQCSLDLPLSPPSA